MHDPQDQSALFNVHKQAWKSATACRVTLQSKRRVLRRYETTTEDVLWPQRAACVSSLNASEAAEAVTQSRDCALPNP